MALSKIALALIKSLVKKKKQGKSYSDQLKPKSKTKAISKPELEKEGEYFRRRSRLQASVDDAIKIRLGLKKPVSRIEVVNSPLRKMKKSEGIFEGKKVSQEKASTKKPKAKPMNTAKKKAAGKKRMKNIPKKADKKIEGSGSQSARPKGSIGKTKSQDSPTGSVAGASMKDTKKTHARKVAGVKGTTKDGIPREMEAEYNATPKKYLRYMRAALTSRDPVKVRKAFTGSNLTPVMFIRIYNKRN